MGNNTYTQLLYIVCVIRHMIYNICVLQFMSGCFLYWSFLYFTFILQEPLQPKDIADAVHYIMSAPPQVEVSCGMIVTFYNLLVREMTASNKYQ